MKRTVISGLVLILLSSAPLGGCRRNETVTAPPPSPVSSKPAADGAGSGAALFKQYCSTCHPDGGNVSDPERTLHGAALKRNHITTSDDIVRIMRNPISRMIRFDPATISDQDARAIAEYILATFK